MGARHVPVGGSVHSVVISSDQIPHVEPKLGDSETGGFRPQRSLRYLPEWAETEEVARHWKPIWSAEFFVANPIGFEAAHAPTPDSVSSGLSVCL